MAMNYDRARQDLGNIALLEHVNVTIPDQRLATIFYVSGLGLTRDPYLMTGVDNMWVNVGRSQFHLPSRGTQVLRGHVGIVLPDLAALGRRLENVAPLLAETRFSWARREGTVEATCPWGNRYRCHAPAPQFGDSELAIAYVEFDVPRGTAPGITRFYEGVMGAHARLRPAHRRWPSLPPAPRSTCDSGKPITRSPLTTDTTCRSTSPTSPARTAGLRSAVSSPRSRASTSTVSATSWT